MAALALKPWRDCSGCDPPRRSAGFAVDSAGARADWLQPREAPEPHPRGDQHGMPDLARERFALNHMVAPKTPLPAFFGLARALDLAGVEIRNDIAGIAILDGTRPERVRELADEAGINILTINALQRFNEWTAEREREAVGLAGYAAACGAAALVLVPVNDGTGRADGVRQKNAATALKGLAPILADHGILGFVEPLGFEICSLRSKREAAEAIAEANGSRVLRLVHDTFHHYLAGERDIFPTETGLVHISGVTDRTLPTGELRDAHRVLVDAADRLDNVEQIAGLLAGGFAGVFSFEPFAEEAHAASDIRASLEASMGFIRGALRA